MEDFIISTNEPNRVEFENIIKKTVQGLTGINENLVRPAWQRRSPAMPPQGVDWCSFYIINENTKGMWRGSGKNLPERVEQELITIFYGDNSWENAGKWRSGLLIEQNRFLFYDKNIAVIECKERINLPIDINNINVYRTDVKVLLSVAYERIFEINSFAYPPEMNYKFKGEI